MVRVPRRFSALLLVASTVLATAACSSDSGALPPVMVSVDDVDGTTVEVPLGNSLVITGDDETYKEWDASIEDDSILTFTPGRDDGSAQFNPGFETKKEGTTDVTMENSESGDTLEFTVTVTPKSGTGGY